jgi:hypothetical protein
MKLTKLVPPICASLDKTQVKRPAEDQGGNRRIIFRWIFRKWDVEAWSGWMWLRLGTGGGNVQTP